MLKIFIGYDEKESVSYYTLAHSIMRRSSIPIDIIPLSRCNLKEVYLRPRAENESTDFSLSRFIIPYLCDYQGWALFMDCDMLCRADIAELAREICLPNEYKGVFVVKHDYIPKTQTKFLNQTQAKYHRKNWSSVMLFNNKRCQKLTPEYVHKASGLELHQFHWLEDQQIGELNKEWNWLVSEYDYNNLAKLVHFTLGGPWFRDYQSCDYADEWRKEFQDMSKAVEYAA